MPRKTGCKPKGGKAKPNRDQPTLEQCTEHSGDHSSTGLSPSHDPAGQSTLNLREDREGLSDSPETNELKPDTKVKKEDTDAPSPTPTTPTNPEPSTSSATAEKTTPTSNETQQPPVEADTRPSDNGESTAPQRSKHKPSAPPKRESRPRRRGKKETEDDPRQDQTQLTQYYQVRRSTRKCKTLIENEEFEELATKIRNKCEDDLEVIEDKVKGRGVVSTRARRKGEFICEYSGDLISYEEAKTREEKYSQDSDTGCYMYYFEHKNTKYCVDATIDNGRMGRLLNHSRTQANVTTKLYEVDGRPYLCLMALTDINSGVELLYDYGERNRVAIESHPWLTS